MRVPVYRFMTELNSEHKQKHTLTIEGVCELLRGEDAEPYFGQAGKPILSYLVIPNDIYIGIKVHKKSSAKIAIGCQILSYYKGFIYTAELYGTMFISRADVGIRLIKDSIERNQEGRPAQHKKYTELLEEIIAQHKFYKWKKKGEKDGKR